MNKVVVVNPVNDIRSSNGLVMGRHIARRGGSFRSKTRLYFNDINIISHHRAYISSPDESLVTLGFRVIRGHQA